MDPFHSIPSAPTSVPILPVTLPLTPFANPNTHTQAPPAYQPPQASQQQTLPQLQPRYQQPLPLTPPTPVPLTGYNGQAGDTNGRIKDAIEFSAFAISALKVTNSADRYRSPEFQILCLSFILLNLEIFILSAFSFFLCDAAQ